MGWITILDYREGQVICEEYNDKIEDLDTYVDDKMGHSDYYYMSTNGLDLQITELDDENTTIITKN